MKEYQVIISFTNSGAKTEIKFSKAVNTFNELKQEFLKRFGNINNCPNKALKEKPIVKRLTYEASSINEWVTSVNKTERWKLEIR